MILVEAVLLLRAQDDRLKDDANAQGIVLKVEHMNRELNASLDSAMLPGDSDARTWKEGILKDYSEASLSSSILHGESPWFHLIL